MSDSLNRASAKRLVPMLERMRDAMRALDQEQVTEEQLREGIAAIEALPPHIRVQHVALLRMLRRKLG